MTSTSTLRRASVALAIFALACGDSTGPNTNLSDEQIGELIEVMNTVSFLGNAPVPGADLQGAALRLAPKSANATVTLSESADCPNGGSASWNGTVTSDEEAGTMSANVTQDFEGCAATSEQGHVWTFDGDPNIVTTLSASSNETTGAFSLTATQKGGLKFSSDIATGGCQIDLTLTVTGTETSFSSSINGTVCGRSFQQTVEATQ